MSNAANSRIANNAVDTIAEIVRIADAALVSDDIRMPKAALFSILKTIKKFSSAEMKEPS